MLYYYIGKTYLVPIYIKKICIYISVYKIDYKYYIQYT